MEITVGNVYSKVTQCSAEEFTQYRKALTFFVPNYWFSPRFKAGNWGGQIYLFSNKKFPTGLLSLVKQAVPNLIVRERKSRVDISDIKDDFLNHKRMNGKYSYQLDVVKTAIKKRRGIVSIATGGGKTIIAAGVIKYLDIPTLFLVPTRDLLAQTHKVFTEEIGGKIGIWGNGKEDLQHITVGMPKTITNRISTKKYREFVESIQCIWADECHLAGSKTWQTVLKACIGASYRFGLSGTALVKSDLDNANVMAYMGEEIYKISNDDLIKLQANSTPLVTFFKIIHLTGEEEYTGIYNDCIVNGKLRNQTVVETAISLLKNPTETVLILVQKIPHGLVLQKLFSEKGVDITFCYGDSEVEFREQSLEDLRSGKIRCLILSRIGELGIDVPCLSSLIYAGGGKSTVGTLQRIGRLLRNPEQLENQVNYFDFYDLNVRFLEKHSQKRLEDYTAEGFEIQYIRV